MAEKDETYADELTEDEVSKAIAWINEKATSPIDACPVCGSRHNTVLNAMGRLGFSDVSSPGTMPLVVTLCYTCGFVRLFNAILLGLRPSDDPEAVAAIYAEIAEQDGKEASDASTAA